MAEQKTLSLKDCCALAICKYVLNADADTLADAFVTVVPHDGKICTTSIDGSQIQLSGLFYLWHCLCLVHFSWAKPDQAKWVEVQTMCQPATKLRTLVTLKWEEGRGGVGVGVVTWSGGARSRWNNLRSQLSEKETVQASQGGSCHSSRTGGGGQKTKTSKLDFLLLLPSWHPRSH